MNTMVSWRDYEGVEGFYGQASPTELNDLRKALVAGNAINPPGSVVAGDGFALRVESLERTLKNTTFRAEHIRLWRAIPKRPGYNTVEEFNQIQSYGSLDTGAFLEEGALPNETDASYQRQFAIVKFMGVTRRVSHVMTLVKPAHGNVIAQETIAGTMYLLQQVEQNLFFGRSDMDAVQWDGYEKLIEDGTGASAVTTSANIIDLRGQPLTEDRLIDAALTIMDAPNFGLPTHLHLNPKVKADLVKTFFPKARYDLLGKTDQGLVGLDIKGFTSPAGDIRFEPNVFITNGGVVSSIQAGANGGAIGDPSMRPASPTISVAIAVASSTSSQFAASDAGSYFYWVVAVNRFGASIPVAVNGSAQAVAAGQHVTFTVLPGPGPTPAFYKIYRTSVNGAQTNAALILKVANAGGAGAQAIADENARMPFTTSAFMFQQNLENMSFIQLAPMIKIPLATVDPSLRWMQLLYGVPVLYTPKHNVVFRNVGRAPDFVGAP